MDADVCDSVTYITYTLMFDIILYRQGGVSSVCWGPGWSVEGSRFKPQSRQPLREVANPQIHSHKKSMGIFYRSFKNVKCTNKHKCKWNTMSAGMNSSAEQLARQSSSAVNSSTLWWTGQLPGVNTCNWINVKCSTAENAHSTIAG